MVERAANFDSGTNCIFTKCVSFPCQAKVDIKRIVYGVVWYGMAWYDMVWYITVRYKLSPGDLGCSSTWLAAMAQPEDV